MYSFILEKPLCAGIYTSKWFFCLTGSFHKPPTGLQTVNLFMRNLVYLRYRTRYLGNNIYNNPYLVLLRTGSGDFSFFLLA
jgi:hypothetical protein